MVSPEVQEIRQQAYLHGQEASGSHAEALARLKAQAEETRRKTKETARKFSLSAYGAYAPALGEVREEIKFEKRRGYLPWHVSELEPLRTERVGLKTERERERVGIRQQRAEIIAEISKAEKEGETELAAQLAAQLREISEWKEEAVGVQVAHEVEVKAVGEELDPYRIVVDGEEGYNLAKMYDEGYTDKELLDFGFTKADLKEVKKSIAKAEAIELELAPYKSNGDYEVYKMYGEGYTPSKLEDLGFKIEDVQDSWNEWNELSPSQQKEVIETGQYTVVIPPKDQFAQALEAGDIPADSTYVGPTKEGGFEYQSPGTAESYYEVETSTGKKKIPAATWEGYSDVEQLAVVLGRAPTREEYRHYALEQELGIHSLAPGVSQLQDLPPSWLGGALAGTAELLTRGPGSFITFPIWGIQSRIPGMQYIERYHLAEAAAIERWEKQYPEMRTMGELVSPLQVAGFPATRAWYPQITTKDIAPMEWAATGINIALLTLPVWAPPAIRGFKWVGTKIGGVAQKFTSRFGTWPFSEPVGLKKIPPISTKAPLPTKVSPWTRQGWDAFVKSLKPKYQPWQVKPVRRGPTPGVPTRTYPTVRRVGPAEVTGAAWERMWKPSKVSPTLPTAPVGGVTEWLRPRIQAAFPQLTYATGWAVTPTGRFMPAGTTPILLPDVPFLIPMQTLGFPAYRTTATLIPGQVGQLTITQVKQLTPQQIKQLTPAQIKQLTPQQVQQLNPAVLTTTQLQALTITQIKSMTAAQVQNLTATQVKNLTSTQVQALTSTQIKNMTSTQVKALTSTQVQSMTTTQVQALTSTQIKNLTTTQVKSLTTTQLKSMTSTQLKNLTSTQLKAMTSTQLKIVNKVTKKVPFKRPPFLKPKAKGKSPIMLDGLPLVATRQQGFVERAYYTDKKDVKARSTYNPEESGKSHRMLETFGPKMGYMISEDLGQVDVFMDLDKKTVRFEGDGMETDVGKRHPSPGKGMTIKRKATGLKRVYA